MCKINCSLALLWAIASVFVAVCENESAFSECNSCFTNSDNSTCAVPNCDCSLTVKNRTESQSFLVLNEPTILCVDERLIGFNWTVNKPFLYFIEVTQDGVAVKYTNATRCGFALITHLTPNSEYSFRLFAFSSNGTVAKSAYTRIKTPEINHKPLPVSNFRVERLEMMSFDNYKATLAWQPAENDSSCYYNVVWFDKHKLEDYYDEFTVLNAKYANNRFEKEDLTFGNTYTIAIMASSLNGRSESEKRTINLTIPSCLESNFSMDFCVPEKPTNLTIRETLIDAKTSTYDVQLKWKAPKVSPKYYLISLVNFTTSDRNASFLNVSGEKTEAVFEHVRLAVHYQVFLQAGSKAGLSPSVIHHRLINVTSANFVKLNRSRGENFIYFIVLGPFTVIFLTMICLIIGYILYSRKRLKPNLEQSCKFIKEVTEKSDFSPNSGYCTEFKRSETYDEWEIDDKLIIVQSVLGEGAFGMVKHGWYCPKEDSEKIQVAVKMLKEMPTADEFRQFQQEIEIMKSVPEHPHVVKFFGCVTKRIPTRPMLIVEFCSNGDLQTYLRSAYENLNNHFKQREFDAQNQQEFSNILYDIQENDYLNQFYLQPKDLIAIARQVALGMVHLSNCKVLHRDLAARNVLICSDNTIKISDFGLSRDVYCNSVYCKTGTGKLPIRWMALESLTHQTYTTQSDVWSFGILLWEIVTLGATPYPGIQTRDLLALLKKGHRMDQPENCSEDLYAIMSSCWRPFPKERPNFTDLCSSLDRLLENESDYLTLNAVLASNHVVGGDYDNNEE